MPRTVWVYLHSNIQIFLVGSVKRIFSAFSRSRSSKVINFGTNRRRVFDFLLVSCHSILGHILHRFRDIASFILGVFPMAEIAADVVVILNNASHYRANGVTD